ncbi:MAG TPA: RNA polymerase sigma factor [bacterium]|nr:RNA polymerase sigma factor [bacterium]
MTDRPEADRWSQLLALLDPVHRQAVTTARRLAASSDEGDDLYQESVLQAFRKLDTLRDEAKFRSWFFAILISKHRTRMRRTFWRRFLPFEDAASAERGPAMDPGFGEDEWVRSRRMSQALHALNPGERTALVLHEMQGFTTEEIAGMQGVTPSTVRSRLARGREKLSKYYVRRGWVDDAASSRANLAAVHLEGSR